MFAKKNRLGKTADVQKVFARGRAFFNPWFTVKFNAGPQAEPRFTVVVSTKVSKNAVERNRLKRQVREFIRLNLKSLALGDYVVMVKPSAAGLPGELLRKNLEGLLIKSRLLS